MSFTSPPDLSQLPLSKPDTSTDIIRPRKLGTVNCINIARQGEPITLRYFGASAVCGATGQAHATPEQAESDVLAWADGKPVAYEQQAVVPLATINSLVDAALAEIQAQNWIAVGERLPVDEIDNHDNPFGTTLVLVARPALAYVSAVALGYRYDGDWFIVREGAEDDFIDNSVTHWQPHPAAPTQGKEVARG
jgi:hypothetical protein